MFFIWVWGIINSYIVKPVDSALVSATVWLHHSDIRSNDDIQSEIAESQGKIKIKQVADHQVVQANDGVTLARIGKQWIPYTVVETVEGSPGNPVFSTPYEYYERYVRLRYLKPRLVVPATIAVFVSALYLLGKFLTVGIGRFIWHQAEYLITQIPIIRNVYSSVKQITDFAFNETEFEYTRVVAVEYPRRGIWSMGFVTGEGLHDVKTAADQPILTVLMPTSPMPATGFTISVPKSETVDLDITIDQAIQFCVSCGVVVPEHQQNSSTLPGEVRRRIRRVQEAANGAANDIDSDNEPVQE
ncbi:MAG: DUF502 domain-containing protein [Mariniblastus sp.]|nr:DUF502 domain-containing protein [Mariniblastus sp.]